MDKEDKLARFERSVVPFMDAAYNLARWLTRNDHDAQDVVQEAFLRAFRFFDGFRGGDSRAWLLAIVRNTFYSWIRQNRDDERRQTVDADTAVAENPAKNPDAILLRETMEASLRRSIEDLPAEYREVLILRELEGMSYKEIAGIADLPLGTVMSRLARARRQLRDILNSGGEEGEK